MHYINLISVPMILMFGLAAYLFSSWLTRGGKRPFSESFSKIGWVPIGFLALCSLTSVSVWWSGPVEWIPFSLGFGGNPHAFTFGIHLDRISGTMATFIAFLGLIIHHYSIGHLKGEERRSAFLFRLSLTITAALLQALSPSLIQFAFAWIWVSLGLQNLLSTNADRPLAQASARLKFLISRFGDVAMVLAILTLLRDYGSTDLRNLSLPLTFPHSTGWIPSWLPAAPFFLVVAAFLKTAALPFHGWLLGSLEAPTPVSALLHAGVINAGGYLLIRFHPIFQGYETALNLLAILVLPSIVLGPIAMWAQSDFKRGLAWSTVGQMGFMLLQCALGAFGPAMLHIFGHGLYKANAFLRSGTLAGMKEKKPAYPGVKTSVSRMLLGLTSGYVGLTLTYSLFGVALGTAPGGWTLIFIQCLAVGQLAASPSFGGSLWTLRGGLALLGGFLYGFATLGFEVMMASEMIHSVALEQRGGVGMMISFVILLSLACLGMLWLSLETIVQKRFGMRLFVLAAQGFQLGPKNIVPDRLRLSKPAIPTDSFKPLTLQEAI